MEPRGTWNSEPHGRWDALQGFADDRVTGILSPFSTTALPPSLKVITIII